MLNIEKLHPQFGARVIGFDLDRCDDTAYVGRLDALFESHSVLVLPDLNVNDEQQLALSRGLGPLEVTKTGTLGTGSNLVILTNVDERGALVPESHKQWLEGQGNQLWHSDSSFKKVPALASLLSAREIPAQGGQTQFVSMRAAWRDLPARLRKQVTGRIGVHDYGWSRAQISPDLMTDAERAELPPVLQTLTRENPTTGDIGLYLGSHLASIVGMEQAQARALIDELQALATQEHRIYTHTWRPGDLVIWDNRFTMHRGRPYPSNQRRYMVRTTVAGDEPTVPATEPIPPPAWQAPVSP